MPETTTTSVKIKEIAASNTEMDIASEDAQIDLEITVEEIPDSITSDIYDINKEENIISKISPNTTLNQFKENVEAYPNVTIIDKEGNTIGDEDIIGTGMTLKVGETLTFTVVVMGDTDGNGEITVTDLAQLKLHYIGKEFLTGASLNAADMNYDNEITITDLAKMKLVFIGKVEI